MCIHTYTYYRRSNYLTELRVQRFWIDNIFEIRFLEINSVKKDLIIINLLMRF